MKNKLAKETERTVRARNKLKKRLGILDEKVTEGALEKKTDEIHRWISRHANDRVVLKKKSISLFDSNKNAAKMSSKVQKMADAMTEE
ncbi:MAG: hypothetical protein SP4CHLAM5_01080 [Chlamydiia bacterium]|nr:hypothetical protein [Chlamydiia bacterium]MCH9617984.1 hypothetical protein [Chlamydiia bacterium]MCH9623691.1 hypothetical protein [Chlamydiia bacterium]